MLTKLDLGYARGGELAGGPKQPDDAVDVLWGDRGRFEPARSLRLSVPHAAATAIGDLDNDGQNDLAVAVHQGHDKFATDSQIFFGLGQRRFVRSKHPLGTEGAGDVAIVPASDHHPARAIFCNRLGGTVHEAVPLQVYWGNSSGFDPTNYWEIPFDSGYEASAADLNADGYVDLVALNSGHGGEVIRASPLLGANIFWGSENGIRFGKSANSCPRIRTRIQQRRRLGSRRILGSGTRRLRPGKRQSAQCTRCSVWVGKGF